MYDMMKKQNFGVEIELTGITRQKAAKTITAMAYVMTPGHRPELPSPPYLATIAKGYEDFDLDPEPLIQAVADTRRLRR